MALQWSCRASNIGATHSLCNANGYYAYYALHGLFNHQSDWIYFYFCAYQKSFTINYLAKILALTISAFFAEFSLLAEGCHRCSTSVAQAPDLRLMPERCKRNTKSASSCPHPCKCSSKPWIPKTSWRQAAILQPLIRRHSKCEYIRKALSGILNNKGKSLFNSPLSRLHKALIRNSL